MVSIGSSLFNTPLTSDAMEHTGSDLDHEVRIGNLSDVCNDVGSFAVASGTFRSSHTILVYDVYCCPQQP